MSKIVAIVEPIRAGRYARLPKIEPVHESVAGVALTLLVPVQRPEIASKACVFNHLPGHEFLSGGNIVPFSNIAGLLRVIWPRGTALHPISRVPGSPALIRGNCGCAAFKTKTGVICPGVKNGVPSAIDDLWTVLLRCCREEPAQQSATRWAQFILAIR